MLGCSCCLLYSHWCCLFQEYLANNRRYKSKTTISIVRTNSYQFENLFRFCYLIIFKQQTQKNNTKNHNPWFRVFFFIFFSFCVLCPTKCMNKKKKKLALLRMVIYNGNMMGVVFYITTYFSHPTTITQLYGCCSKSAQFCQP